MNDRYEDMYQAAARYYVQSETMESIARALRLSRSSVSRLLKEARESGMVRISLADHHGSASPMATALSQIFGVRVHMVSVRENANEAARFEQVARLAGRMLTEMVDDHQLIGLAWGVTLSHITGHLGRRPLVDATVVQINGGANQSNSGIPYIGEILQSFADAFDAKVMLFPVPAFFDYAATKGALDTMTLGLAREVATEGIRVNAVLAGHIYTELHASGGEPNRVERVKSQVPMGRGGRPEEVAHAILWLLSDEASYTTGALVDVAGGK